MKSKTISKGKAMDCGCKPYPPEQIATMFWLVSIVSTGLLLSASLAVRLEAVAYQVVGMVFTYYFIRRHAAKAQS